MTKPAFILFCCCLSANIFAQNRVATNFQIGKTVLGFLTESAFLDTLQVPTKTNISNDSVLFVLDKKIATQRIMDSTFIFVWDKKQRILSSRMIKIRDFWTIFPNKRIELFLITTNTITVQPARFDGENRFVLDNMLCCQAPNTCVIQKNGVSKSVPIIPPCFFNSVRVVFSTTQNKYIVESVMQAECDYPKEYRRTKFARWYLK
jgi:hypothetical protein